LEVNCYLQAPVDLLQGEKEEGEEEVGLAPEAFTEEIRKP
jgi:hypothetical protein